MSFKEEFSLAIGPSMLAVGVVSIYMALIAPMEKTEINMAVAMGIWFLLSFIFAFLYTAFTQKGGQKLEKAKVIIGLHQCNCNIMQDTKEAPTKGGGWTNYTIFRCSCGVTEIIPEENFLLCTEEHQKVALTAFRQNEQKLVLRNHPQNSLAIIN